MCLFQTDTYLCGCPVKVSAFLQQAAGQRQSQPTSTAGEVCKTTLLPCDEKPCRAMYSKEAVTEKRYCSKCEEPEFHDYSNTILMTEEDEVELQNMLDLSEKQTQDSSIPAKDINEYLPVLGAITEGPEAEAEKKYQQDYEASKSGIKVLRLL